MTSFQWSGRPDPDGNTYQFYQTTPGVSLNWSGISNPQIDALLDQVPRGRPSQAERKKLFSQAHPDPAGRAADGLHRASGRAQGLRARRCRATTPIPDGMMRFKDVWLK